MPRLPKKPYVKSVNEIIEAALTLTTPSGRTVSTKNLAARIAAVMGRQTMNTSQVIEALNAAGIEINSTHLRRYINQTLITATTNAKGPNRLPLRYPAGGMVKVPIFINVAWGQYRVATPTERQQHAREKLAKHESLGSGLRPAPEEVGLVVPSTHALRARAQYETIAPLFADARAAGEVNPLRDLLRSTIRAELRNLLQQEADMGSWLQDMVTERKT